MKRQEIELVGFGIVVTGDIFVCYRIAGVRRYFWVQTGAEIVEGE